MPNGKHRVNTLDDVRVWIANHGGEIDEKWKTQEELNRAVNEAFNKLFEKVDALSMKIAYATGAAMLLGAIVALAVQSIWGR